MSKQKKRIGSRVFGSKLTAILSISLVLVLFGIMIVIGLFAKDLSDTAKEHIRLTLVLDDDIKSAELLSLQQDLEKAPWTKKFDYVSKEDALAELAEELGENPLDLLGYNPLPASIEINLDPEYARTDSIKGIEKSLKKKDYIQEVVYREELINLVNSNILSIGRLL
ncbi:MAG: permease-like cell division protein FtsX, partial [Bacteroidales bacterium]|nr:permease-like cell division protein FtsX [Bacteroidales bacterium]